MRKIELGNFIFGNSRGFYEFPNREMVNSNEWQSLLKSANLDSYGYKNEEHQNDKDTNFRGGISNDIFEIYPYYWGECTCGMEIKNKPCLDSCELMRHNFYYKPLNFWIDWYKYPFRDSYMSDGLSEKEILKIFKECKDFIEKRK